MFKLLVSGDRNWTWDDSSYIFDKLDDIHGAYGLDAIIEGCAPGVDEITESWAEWRHVTNLHYPADWNNIKYRNRNGKSFAGNVRNSDMLALGEPNHVFAFHLHLDQSRGTKDMVTKALKAGVPVSVWPQDEWLERKW